MAIPLVGSSFKRSVPAPREILVGDSSTFKTSNGSWVARNSATVTWDSTPANSLLGSLYGNTNGSLKVVTDNIDKGARIALPGTYYVNSHYQALVALYFEPGTSNGSYAVRLGQDTSSDFYTQTFSPDFERDGGSLYKPWKFILVDWTPSSTDKTDAYLSVYRLTGASSHTMHIGLARVTQVKMGEAGFEAGITLPRSGNNTYERDVLSVIYPEQPNSWQGARLGISPWVQYKSSAVLTLNPGRVGIMAEDGANDAEVIADNTWGLGLYSGANSDTTGNITYEGLNIEIGWDWVGLYISEKDQYTIQMYADWVRTETLGPTWQAGTAYPGGSSVIPVAGSNGHLYYTYSGGISGGSEPTWITNGSSFVDGTVTWYDRGLLGQSYDIELADQGISGWKAVDKAGNPTGLLSKSPFRHLAAAPSSPSEGDCYYDTVTHKLRVYNGTSWNDCW